MSRESILVCLYVNRPLGGGVNQLKDVEFSARNAHGKTSHAVAYCWSFHSVGEISQCAIEADVRARLGDPNASLNSDELSNRTPIIAPPVSNAGGF